MADDRAEHVLAEPAAPELVAPAKDFSAASFAIPQEARPAAEKPEWRAMARGAALSFGAGIAFLFVTGLAEQSLVKIDAGGGLYRGVTAAGLAVSTACLFLGAVRAIRALVGMIRTDEQVGWAWPAFTLIGPLVGGSFFTLVGAFLTLWATAGFRRGRQLRSYGRVVLPKLAEAPAWAALPVRPEADAALRARLAAQWRENGRTEHASVAAFARLTLDLLALGAPPALIESAQKDALDEIRHAELCFSLARGLDGDSAGPGPFHEAQRARTLPPGRTLALAALAVDSLIDGALHEGISARVIARLVPRCTDPAVREVLRVLAADEGRHAAHGWDVVEWCLAEGGASVAEALRGALLALPRSIHVEADPASRDGAWEPLGIPGAALESEEHAKARAALIRRVESLTLRAA